MLEKSKNGNNSIFFAYQSFLNIKFIIYYYIFLLRLQNRNILVLCLIIVSPSLEFSYRIAIQEMSMSSELLTFILQLRWSGGGVTVSHCYSYFLEYRLFFFCCHEYVCMYIFINIVCMCSHWSCLPNGVVAIGGGIWKHKVFAKRMWRLTPF